jgi:WD40 repeat protein
MNPFDQLNVERSASVDAENPWPGLAPFTEDQGAFFHGRDDEIDDLTQIARLRALVVLFGQSGLGKSSLLQAGVFPRLRAHGFCPIYIRLDHAENAPPLTEQITSLVIAETSRVGTWTKPNAAKPGETLWELFHHRDDHLMGANGQPIIPVLVFDQFEELFTLGAAAGARRARAVAFMAELAELVENRPSEQLVARLEGSEDELHAFDFGRTDYRVIITLREDFLPELEGMKTIMPALMANRMRLARMTGKQALEAVLNPGGALVTEEVARAIVEFVAGARGGSAERLAELEVEPPFLSVICRELNERRRKLGQAQISADLVTGNRREILTDFYERSVADLPEEMRAFVEDHLLTKSGFRDNLALETALEEPGVTKPLIDTLVSRRLLRLEDRLGTQRVELTHDVLADVIRASRDTRQQRLTLEKERQRERLTRRRMWLARTIAAALLIVVAGVSWVAWRAVRAEREQERLRGEETALRQQAQTRELAARRLAYGSDLRALQVALDHNNLGRARQLLNRQRPKPGESDLRGWEWRYLWQFCRNEAQSVLGQLPSSATSVTASSDGNWIAAGESMDGHVSLWNRDTAERIQLPVGDNIVRVTFSPTAPLLATGMSAMEGTQRSYRVQLWSLESRTVVRELEMTGTVVGLIFSADGKSLLTCTLGAASEVAVWNIADGTKIARCRAPNPVFQSRWSFVAATADLKLAAYGSNDGNLHLLDLSTGQKRWSTRGADEWVMSLKFSPNGQTLASGAGLEESAIRLWDVEGGEELGRLEGHSRFVTQLAFSADGKTLFSASGDQTVRVWDVASRRSVRTLRGHEMEVSSLALLPDNRTVVTGSKDGSVHVWDTQVYVRPPIVTIKEVPRAWRFSADGQSIIVVTGDGSVVRRRGADLAEITPIMKIDSALYLPRFGLDSTLIAQGVRGAPGDLEAKLKIWDWERRAVVTEIATGQRRQMIPLAVTPGGKSVLAINGNSGANLNLTEWEIPSGRQIGSWPVANASGQGNVLTVSDVAKQAIMLGRDGAHLHIDLVTGRQTPLQIDLKRTPAQAGGAFSHDQRLFAAPSMFGWLRVLDLTRPGFPEVALLSAGVTAYHSALFSPDNQRLVTGSSGKTGIMFWDANSFEPLLVLPAEGSIFRNLAFSPDGNTLGATSGVGGSGALTFWRAPSWAEIDAAERKDTGKSSP